MSEERETYIQPLHQSSIGTCLHCKRAYMFRYRWCIFPKQKPFAVAANQGNLLHRLIEAGPDNIEMVRTKVKERIQYLIGHIEAGEDLLGYLAQEVNELDNQFDKALVMATILWEKYPRPEHHEILAKEKSVEMGLRLSRPGDPPLPVDTIRLGGRLDEIVLDTKSGLIYIKDYKTSSRDVMFTLAGYHWSLQCRLYRLLAGALLQDPSFAPRGHTPDGFILDILQVPTISMGGGDRDYTEHEHTLTRGPRKGETEMRRDYEGEPKFENYLQRCREWYAREGNNAVQSFAIRFTEPVLPDELLLDLQVAAVYQVLPAGNPGLFPRDETTSHCKYMNRICPYYDLCCTDEASWPGIIESKYEVKPPKEKKEESEQIVSNKLGTVPDES